MSGEFVFTTQDGHDTAEGFDRRVKNRELLFFAPPWEQVIDGLAKYAYQETYGFVPEPDDDTFDYFDFKHTVENITRGQCLSSIEGLIGQDTTHEDAFSFNRKFSEWREKAIEGISSLDEQGELKETLLYAISIDTVSSFTAWTSGKIDGLLQSNTLSESDRRFWIEQSRIWKFRQSFLEMSRKMALDLNTLSL